MDPYRHANLWLAAKTGAGASTYRIAAGALDIFGRIGGRSAQAKAPGIMNGNYAILDIPNQASFKDGTKDGGGGSGFLRAAIGPPYFFPVIGP